MTGVVRLGTDIELVGRRAELATLHRALEQAAAGRPSGILLAGEAGVGKSRLIGELAASGAAVFVGHCLDAAESALPYLPFTEIMAEVVGGRPDLVDAHPALHRLLPGRHPRAAPAVEDRRLGQVQLFDAVLSTLEAVSAAQPALVVVEDLHWADRSSRDLLVFLLSRLAGQHLVLLASYRSDDLHRRHPLRPVLSELARLPAVQRLELAALGPADTLELVRRLAGGRLGEEAQRRAARRSEGNAFFAEELVSAGSDGMPGALAELLVARVEALTPTAQRVLRTASVAGRRVRHDQLAAVSGLPVDELEQALRDAVSEHLLVADPGSAGGEDGYAFRHALLREAVYQELLPGERSRIHAAYAALLAEPEPAGGPRPGRAAQLAHHALASHDLPLALGASVRAAAEADERDAPAELLLHAERALELWAAVPEAEAVAGVDEGTVTRWAARGASATGDPDRGVALARRALALAERRGDAPLRSSVLRSYARLLLDLGGWDREALAAAEQALTLLADTPPSGDQAWAYATLARALYRLDRMADARAAATAAAAIAATQPATDPSAVGATADAQISLALGEEHDGQPDRARERLIGTVELARRAGQLAVELRAHFAIGMSLLDEGRLRAAGDRFAEGIARAEATGTTWSGFGLDMRVALVVARFLHGDWDAAQEAAELAGESVSATVATRLTAAGLLVAAARGRFEAVQRRLGELRDPPPRDDQVIMFVGQAGAEAALWQGHPEEAARCVRSALDGLRTSAADGLAPHLGGIMLAALGVAAQAELAQAERAQAELTHARTSTNRTPAGGSRARRSGRGRHPGRSAIGRPAAGTRWTRSPWPASWPRSPSEQRPRACPGRRSGTGGPGLAAPRPGGADPGRGPL